MALRTLYHIQDNFVVETKSELCAMRDDLARKEHFAIVLEHLTSHVVFCQVAQDKKDPMRYLSKGKGQMTCHDPKGSFSKEL